MRMITKNVMTLAVVCLTIGALWFTNRVAIPKTATWEDVVSESKTGGYKLITTKELSEKYSRDPESLLIVDTRQEWEFQTGHIKCSQFFHGTHLVFPVAESIIP